MLSHPKAVTDLAHWLVDNTASLYSVNNLTGYLKSLGHKAPKSAVSDFLEWFEDAFFLFTARDIRRVPGAQQHQPEEDLLRRPRPGHVGLVGDSGQLGHLLENLVFMALRRLHPEIYYYKTKGGRESTLSSRCGTAPGCWSRFANPWPNRRRKKREMAALTEAIAELNLKSGTIVTRNEDARIDTGRGTIEVVPAWRFLLDLPESMG